MKKLILSASVLSSIAAHGQQKDTVKMNKMDEVIINAYIKKTVNTRIKCRFERLKIRRSTPQLTVLL